MSHPSRADDGIIRTSSGRETYAPDGLVSDHDQYTEPYEKVESSRASSEASMGQFMPISSGRHHEKLESAEQSAESSDYYDKSTPLSRQGTQATIGDVDRRELQRILTTLSRRRSSIVGPDDPAVDPQNESFDLPKFLRMFRHQLEQEGIQTKNVGVAYKNLNVSGSGAALQLQQTVADFLLAPLRLGEWFSFGKKDHKQILRNFDGVVKSGELLIVLGRPGSGCSTLLKTMCGELHGLETDEKSTIHYNGIPQKQMMKEFKGEAIYNQEVSSTELVTVIL